MSEIRDRMAEVEVSIVKIVIGVLSRHFILRMIGTIKASVVPEIEFIINVVNPDISKDFALLYLRVIVLRDV